MQDTLVSIIIPCYNAEQYIAEAIQSALGQSYQRREVIVIDDGSTDRSLEVIKSFSRHIIWETGPNRGGCAARNRGSELAQGSFLQFLDADDILLEDAIMSKVNTGSLPHQIVCSKSKYLSSALGIPCNCFEHNQVVGYHEILRTCAPQTSLPLVPASDFYQVGGFRVGLPCSQEFDLFVRIAFQCDRTFICNNYEGTLIRPRRDSVSRTAAEKMDEASLLVFSEAVQSLQDMRDQRTGVTRQVIARRCARIARRQWRAGKNERALKTIEFARALSPRWHKGVYRNAFSCSVARILGFELYEKTRKQIAALLKS
jgi:glycosyltransferase involved in cell wall biosynthesis